MAVAVYLKLLAKVFITESANKYLISYVTT